MSEKNLYCPQCGTYFAGKTLCPTCKTTLLSAKDTTSTYKQKFKQSELPDNIRVPNTDRATLIVYKKKEFYKNIDIEDREELFVGRSPSAGIWLALETVSKKHARIFKKEDYYFVEDMGSRNGSFVNMEVLSPNRELRLKDGDVIRISGFYLCCHFPEKKKEFFCQETIQDMANPKDSPRGSLEDTSAPISGMQTQIPPRRDLRTTATEYPCMDNMDKPLTRPDERKNILGNLADLASGEECNTIFAIQADRKIKEKFNEAERIVRQYLKPIPEKMGHASLACFYKPLTQIGGDFYSVVPLDDKKLGISLGDVSGHGMPAALIMIACITMLELYGRQSSSPAEALQKVNTEMAGRLDRSKFVTVFYGVLDTETGDFSYASAGHHPPLLFNPERGITFLEGKGPGFGIVRREVSYQEHSVRLTPGDRVVVFTDGVLEAGGIQPESEMNKLIKGFRDVLDGYNGRNFETVLEQIKGQIEDWDSREEFGMERLMDVVRSYASTPLQATLEGIYQALEKFTHPQKVDDDITMIGIDWNR